MTEFGTPEIVKHLSKAAHLEENKGHFEQAENLYRSIVTLEEMAQFPADKIKQAKEDLLQCEMNGANAAMIKLLESQPGPYVGNNGSAKESNDNGIFRQLPYKEGDKVIFHPLPYKQNGSKDTVEFLLDISESMGAEQKTATGSTGTTRLIDTEKEWQEKTNRHIPITTDSDNYLLHPSKGCP